MEASSSARSLWHPQLARYAGVGDPKVASSFVPARLTERPQ